jgi:hypothetical protein
LPTGGDGLTLDGVERLKHVAFNRSHKIPEDWAFCGSL